MQNLKIEPGPKLDWAVAKAIGLKNAIVHASGSGVKRCLITSREWDEMRGIEHPTCEGDVACQRFRPSTDLNAAFAAAECAVGTEYGLGVSITFGDDKWGAYIHCVATKQYVSEAHNTPALAICAAILKLKEKTDETT